VLTDSSRPLLGNCGPFVEPVGDLEQPARGRRKNGPGRGAYGLRRPLDAALGERGLGGTKVPGPWQAFHISYAIPCPFSRISLGAAGGAVTPPAALKASAR
jgi:hypothetical protein